MTEEIISVPLAHAEATLSAHLQAAVDAVDDVEAPVEVRQLQVAPDEHGWRVDKWLATRCPEFSRGYFQHLLQAHAVSLAGQVIGKPATKLKVGQKLQVELRPTAQAQAYLPEALPLTVCYEDEHLLVVDKPAGMVVHPAAGNWTGTLLNALLAYHEGAKHLPRAGIVHRLDKDTSGLMLVGKTQAAVDALVRMIAAREVHRVYVALVAGPWRQGDEVQVDQTIGRDPRNRLRMTVLPAGSGAGKTAQTTVRVLDANAQWAWVGCKLHTGRTHQIRVHMAWLGHPLVGDAVYAGPMALDLTRQALHAHRLGLRHPITGVPLSLQSPLPTDMQKALQLAQLQYNTQQLWQV